MSNIFLVAKDNDEFKEFEGIFGQLLNVFDKDDSDDWKETFSNMTGKIHLLYHFGGLTNLHEYCVEILKVKQRFPENDLCIIPISRGGRVEEATKLFDELESNHNVPDLESYKKFWQEAYEKFKKKKIFFKIMVLCIYLEIAYKTSLQIRKKEIKKLSREIASNVMSDEVVALYPILDTYRKRLREVERMKDTDLKKFITYNTKEKPAAKIEDTHWTQMLKELKNWAYGENVG